ncbi:MAG: class I tRNA ligase family protein, partial [Clostridia bacterium]|nr:class I tRNA ligase family protein [Clostridia bacterium]
KAKEAKIFINKLYNASKFVLQNLEGIELQDITKIKLASKDKWILSELDSLIRSVTKNIDKYALGVATSNLIEFTVSKFCDWYIELSKVDLYGEDKAKKARTQNVLYYVFDKLLKLFHPFIPFVTEYIYQELPFHEETIMRANFPTKVPVKNLKNNFNKVLEIIKAIRNARAEFNVPDNKRTNLYVMIEGQCNETSENLGEIAKLGFGLAIELVTKEPQEKCVKVIYDNVKVFIPMGQLVDGQKEKERIAKEIASLEFEIARSEKMLSNQGFVAKAPASMVENEKAKLENNRAMLVKFQNELKSL